MTPRPGVQYLNNRCAKRTFLGSRQETAIDLYRPCICRNVFHTQAFLKEQIKMTRLSRFSKKNCLATFSSMQRHEFLNSTSVQCARNFRELCTIFHHIQWRKFLSLIEPRLAKINSIIVFLVFFPKKSKSVES